MIIQTNQKRNEGLIHLTEETFIIFKENKPSLLPNPLKQVAGCLLFIIIQTSSSYDFVHSVPKLWVVAVPVCKITL